MTFVIGFIIGFSLAFHLGWYGKFLLTSVKELLKKEPETTGKIINPLPAGYSNVNNMSSGIITPKSPYQIDREEEERLRSIT